MTEQPTASFSKFLRLKLAQADGLRKGERTRYQIKISATEKLNTIGYRELRVADVCENSGISQGTFYLYYKNKTDLATEILQEFLEFFSMLATTEHVDDPFESIYLGNLQHILTAKENPGLWRCLLQVRDEVPEFAELQHKQDAMWYARVGGSIAKRLNTQDSGYLTLLAYALGSMMDEFIRRLVVEKDKRLIKTIKSLQLSDEELAQSLSLIWYRSFYGKDPTNIKASKEVKKFLKTALN